MSIKRALRQARAHFEREPQWAEFISGWGTLAWSVVGWFTPISPTQAPAWALAFMVADDRFWIFKGGMLALLQLAALWCDWRWTRLFCAAMLTWVWSFFAVSMLGGMVPRVAVLPAVLGLTNLMVLLRLVFEIHADRAVGAP